MKAFASILAAAAAGLRLVNALDIDVNSTGQYLNVLSIDRTKLTVPRSIH